MLHYRLFSVNLTGNDQEVTKKVTSDDRLILGFSLSACCFLLCHIEYDTSSSLKLLEVLSGRFNLNLNVFSL